MKPGHCVNHGMVCYITVHQNVSLSLHYSYSILLPFSTFLASLLYLWSFCCPVSLYVPRIVSFEFFLLVDTSLRLHLFFFYLPFPPSCLSQPVSEIYSVSVSSNAANPYLSVCLFSQCVPSVISLPTCSLHLSYLTFFGGFFFQYDSFVVWV